MVAARGELACAEPSSDRRALDCAASAGSFTSPISALRNSSMLWKRSAGSLASAFMMAAAMCGGVAGANCSSDGGSSSMCLANSSPTPSAVNGGRPAIISNSITPSE